MDLPLRSFQDLFLQESRDFSLVCHRSRPSVREVHSGGDLRREDFHFKSATDTEGLKLRRLPSQPLQQYLEQQHSKQHQPEPRRPAGKLATAALGFLSCLGLGTSCAGPKTYAVQDRGILALQDSLNATPAVAPPPSSLDKGTKIEKDGFFGALGEAISDGITRGIDRIEETIRDDDRRNRWLAKQLYRELRKYDDRYKYRDSLGYSMYDENGSIAWPGEEFRWEDIQVGQPRKLQEDFWDDLMFGVQESEEERISKYRTRPHLDDYDDYPNLRFSPRLYGLGSGDFGVGGKFKLETSDRSNWELKFKWREGGDFEAWISWGISF